MVLRLLRLASGPCGLGSNTGTGIFIVIRVRLGLVPSDPAPAPSDDPHEAAGRHGRAARVVPGPGLGVRVQLVLRLAVLPARPRAD